MHALRIWTLATRPKTLILSVSPVLIGTTLAVTEQRFQFALFLFTLLTALGIQITANLANDYFDFLKGADTSTRKGPLRVMQAGLVSIDAMKAAMALVALGTAACGCYLIWVGGWCIATLLLLSLLLAFLYTAGPYPIAYLGLGELFVLPFFGPIATGATYYLQTGSFSGTAFVLGLSPGALSTAVLIINNMRDVEEDRVADKKTLPVRFGKTFGMYEYAACLALCLLTPLFFVFSHPFAALYLFTFFPALKTYRLLCDNRDPHELNALFGKTGQLLLLFTLLFCIGWML